MAISVFPRVDVTGTNRWSPLRTGHWSTRGLIACVPLGQASPGTLYPGTLVGVLGGAARGGGKPQGIDFSTTGSYIELLSAPLAPVRLPTQRATVLCVRQCADTSARTSSLFGAGGGALGDRIGCHCPYSDGTVYWDFGGATNGTTRVSVAFTKTTQVERWAFVAGRNGMAIYRNGVRLASHTTATTRTNGAGQYFGINEDYATTAGGDVQAVYFFALLDAEWVPAQVMEWMANPWLMFGTASVTAGVGAPVATPRTQVIWIA